MKELALKKMISFGIKDMKGMNGILSSNRFKTN